MITLTVSHFWEHFALSMATDALVMSILWFCAQIELTYYELLIVTS